MTLLQTILKRRVCSEPLTLPKPRLPLAHQARAEGEMGWRGLCIVVAAQHTACKPTRGKHPANWRQKLLARVLPLGEGEETCALQACYCDTPQNSQIHFQSLVWKTAQGFKTKQANWCFAGGKWPVWRYQPVCYPHQTVTIIPGDIQLAQPHPQRTCLRIHWGRHFNLKVFSLIFLLLIVLNVRFLYTMGPKSI